MKDLAVIIVHKSIHLMNLWKMQQQSDEPIRAFAARITATADMCGMVVKCTNDACLRDVVYRDHVVHQLIIHGMRENNIRVRVLSRNTSGELTTLDELIAYISAEEAGTAEACWFQTLVWSVHSEGNQLTPNRNKFPTNVNIVVRPSTALQIILKKGRNFVQLGERPAASATKNIIFPKFVIPPKLRR